MAHTPGPWVLDESESGWLLLSNGADVTSEPFDCADADARLMAAGPDLLAALKSLVQLIGDASDAGALYGKHDIAWKQELDGIRFLIERTERTAE
jgi:hypothetical protein